MIGAVTAGGWRRRNRDSSVGAFLLTLAASMIAGCSASRGTCSTQKYCEEMVVLQECREAYNCQYSHSNGSLNSCWGGSDCRNQLTKNDCTKYTNCQWDADPEYEAELAASNCYNTKYCDEIDDFQECEDSYECGVNGGNGHLRQCFAGGDCRTLMAQEECEQYANCGWKGEAAEEESVAEGGEASSSSVMFPAAVWTVAIMLPLLN